MHDDSYYIGRPDFYFEEPLTNVNAIDDLYTFTEKNRSYLNLPADLDFIWFKTEPRRLYGDKIGDTLFKIKRALRNDTQLILLWAGESNVMLDDQMVANLNEFCESISNPVMLITGVLGDWQKEWEGKLNFYLCTLMYFEYESGYEWDMSYDTTNHSRTKKFMSMGTKDYPNRKYLLSKILTNNLAEDGYVSYACLGGGDLALAHFSREEQDKINRVAAFADVHLPLPTIDSSPDAWTRMPREFLTNSYVNMVTDTWFEHWGNTTFISEKVFNAMVHQQMFIMMSPPHTLKQLRDSGYKTFHPYIDESYDNIENNYDRLKAVTEIFINFVAQPIEKIQEVYMQCLPILEHNMQRVKSKPTSKILEMHMRKAINEKTQTN